MCAIFFKIRGLLPTDLTCTKIKNQTIYGGELKEVLKNSQKRDSEGNILKTMYNRCTKKRVSNIYAYIIYIPNTIFTADSILNHQTCGR